MSAPTTGTCEPWATPEDLCGPCATDDDLTDAATDWLQAATNIVYNLSGRQFPGLCEQTVRPCAHTVYDRPMHDAVPGTTWHRSWGTCRCTAGCGCPGRRRIELGAYPVAEIVEVVVDGEVLDPNLYQLDEWRWLVRLDDPDGTNPGWPATQNLGLPDSDPDTFAVTFKWGRIPPPEGVAAVAVLACELAMGCNPDLAGQCRLPKSVTSVTAEGVTMVLSPSDFLDQNGKTGIWEVDLFVRSVNPQRAQRNATVWTPGMRRGATRATPTTGS